MSLLGTFCLMKKKTRSDSIFLNEFYFFQFVKVSLSFHRLPEGSTEDLLSMSQVVFDQLTPLSAYTHKLCTCDKEKTYCSYKQYKECKTNVRGREYHCVLHSSSRKKRDVEFFSRFHGNIDVINEDVGVSVCLPL